MQATPKKDNWTSRCSVYTHTKGVSPSHKKEGNSAVCSNVDGSREYTA